MTYACQWAAHTARYGLETPESAPAQSQADAVPEIQFDIPVSTRWPIQGAQINPGLGWNRFLGRESPFPILKTGHAQLVGRTKCSLGHPARRLRLKQLLPFLAAAPLVPGNRLVHRLLLRMVEHAAQGTNCSGWAEERCGMTGYSHGEESVTLVRAASELEARW